MIIALNELLEEMVPPPPPGMVRLEGFVPEISMGCRALGGMVIVVSLISGVFAVIHRRDEPR